MRKLALTFAVIFSAFSVVAYAQSSENKQSYTQQLQKLFDQTNNQSKAEFDKTYPKPQAPKIESSPQPNANTYTYKQPAVTPKSYEQPAYTTPAPKAPDVAVSAQEKKQNPPVNIFAPPSTNNNQNQSAPNPYR